MEREEKTGLATAAMVLGIIGIVLSFIPIINNAAFVLGVLAFIFGLIMAIKKRALGKSVTGVILGILTIVITLAMQTQFSRSIDEAFDGIDEAFSELDETLGDASGDNTDNLLGNVVDVEVGEFIVDEGEFITDTELTVTVRNLEDDQNSFSIQLEAVDAEGSRLDTDTVYANNLGGGQAQTLEAFQFVTSDAVEALRNAEFRIVSVSRS